MKTALFAGRRSNTADARQAPVASPLAPRHRVPVRHVLHPARVQTKLAVGAPGDALEHEADRVADHVMRMPGAGVQRLSDEGRAAPQANERLRQPNTPDNFERRVRGLQGGGQPLPASERAFFEPRFGRDFSDVRLHTGPAATEMARAVHARAFTFGRSIVLGPGTTDRRLLAHELTHVVQQGGGAAPGIQRLIRTPYPWHGAITPAIGANIRSSPDASTRGNILDSIPRGERVTVLSASGNWLFIETRYRGPALQGYVHHLLVDDATSESMTSSVGTTMVWRPSGPGSGTDFEAWASAATETPFPAVTATTVMNCWEAVLLSAFRAGAITWTWIHNLYTSPPATWIASMSRGPKHHYAVPGPNMPMPQRGDIVFFDGLAHVALATGSGSNVLTFWPPPNTPFTPGGTTDKVKEFTIEALVTWWAANMPPQPVVEFAAPAW